MKTLLKWIVILVIVIIAISVFSEDDKSTPERDFNSDKTKLMAQVMSEDLIKDRLKSPSTAKFQNHPVVVFVGDSSFIVDGYVDSENSFGAMLRTKYRAKVKFIRMRGDDEVWRLLEFNEK